MLTARQAEYVDAYARRREYQGLPQEQLVSLMAVGRDCIKLALNSENLSAYAVKRANYGIEQGHFDGVPYCFEPPVFCARMARRGIMNLADFIACEQAIQEILLDVIAERAVPTYKKPA